MSAETDAAPWRDAETLRRLYVDRELKTHEVGDRLGCSKQTVSRWLNRHDIETAGVGKRDQYTDADLVKHLRAVNADQEFRVTQSDLQDREGPSQKTYQKRFGSWIEALETAGIDPDAPTRPTKHRETLDGDQGTLLVSNPDAARELLRVKVPFMWRDLDVSESLFHRFRVEGVIVHASERPVKNEAVECSYCWEWEPAPDVRGWIREHVDPAGTCPAAGCDATGVSNLGDGVFECSSATCDRRFDRRAAREVLGG